MTTEDKYPRRCAVTCIGIALIIAIVAIAFGHNGAIMAFALTLASILGGVVGWVGKRRLDNGTSKDMPLLQRKT